MHSFRSRHLLLTLLCILDGIDVKIGGPNLGYLTTPAHDTQIELIICSFGSTVAIHYTLC